jgi:hypothetical protein
VAPSTSGIQEPPEPVSEAPRPRLLKRRLRSQSREPSAAPPPALEEPPAPVSAEASVELIKEELASEPPRRVSHPFTSAWCNINSRIPVCLQLLKRRVKTTTIAEVLGLDESSASIDPTILPAEQSRPTSSKRVAIEIDMVDLPPSTPAQTHAVCNANLPSDWPT